MMAPKVVKDNNTNTNHHQHQHHHVDVGDDLVVKSSDLLFMRDNVSTTYNHNTREHTGWPRHRPRCVPVCEINFILYAFCDCWFSVRVYIIIAQFQMRAILLPLFFNSCRACYGPETDLSNSSLADSAISSQEFMNSSAHTSHNSIHSYQKVT